MFILMIFLSMYLCFMIILPQSAMGCFLSVIVIIFGHNCLFVYLLLLLAQAHPNQLHIFFSLEVGG